MRILKSFFVIVDRQNNIQELGNGRFSWPTKNGALQALRYETTSHYGYYCWSKEQKERSLELYNYAFYGDKHYVRHEGKTYTFDTRVNVVEFFLRNVYSIVEIESPLKLV